MTDNSRVGASGRGVLITARRRLPTQLGSRSSRFRCGPPESEAAGRTLRHRPRPALRQSLMSARQRADSEASDAGAETPNSTVGNAEEDAEAAQSVVAAAAAALEADVVAAAAARAKRNRRLLNILRGSVFLSVCQHTSNVQSEPMLVRQLCGKEPLRLARPEESIALGAAAHASVLQALQYQTS